MTGIPKLPSVEEFRLLVAAEPHLNCGDWAARYDCTSEAVRMLCKRAGVEVAKWRKPHKAIRLTADHVAVADGIVSTAAHRLTDFRKTVETSDDRNVIDTAISGLDDLSTALRSGDPSFLNRE